MFLPNLFRTPFPCLWAQNQSKPLNPSFVSITPLPNSYRAPTIFRIEFFSMVEDGMDLTSLSSLEDAGSGEPAASAAVHAPIWEAHTLPAGSPARLHTSDQGPALSPPSSPCGPALSSLSSCSSLALGWKRFITVCMCPPFQVY